MTIGGGTAWLERHQVALYLAGIAVGAAVGWLATWSPALAPAITPVLAVLLFATFLAVPFAAIGRAFTDVRFLAGVAIVNFVVVPPIAFGLSRFVAGDEALVFGVLLVLLTPCVDYVIVFSRLAGGSGDRLLAAAPLLLIAQLLLLPVYLFVFIGPGVAGLIEIAPFAEAFVFLILIPLAAAVVVQAGSRRFAAARAIEGAMQASMVPLLALTLAVVVASQIRAVGESIGALLAVVPLYVAFLAVMVPVGMVAARLARLDVPAGRALVFSGATRNSLVVLPLALALPPELALAPLAVVTQTLVELVGMVILVRLVPRLLPHQVPVGVSPADVAGRPE